MNIDTLVVDVNRERLERTSRVLAEAGCDVRSAVSFEEARREMALRPPDLLITSVQLDAFNGLHLILRGRQEYPQMGAVLIHTVADPVLEREARAAGADYAVTPSPAFLLSVVTRVAAEQKSLSHGRRWPRQRAAEAVPASVDNQSAVVFDFSQGGMRLQLSHLPAPNLRAPMQVMLPSLGVAVRGERVWQGRAEVAGWWCGVRVSAADLPQWQQAVSVMAKLSRVPK
jgi:DNA-binding response OmpR family regulator